MSSVRLRILAFGASLTEGLCSDGCLFHPYTIRLTQLLRSSYSQVNVINAGVSGEAVLSTTMLPRLRQLLASTPNTEKFDWVLILAGTNDTMRDQRPARTVYDGYKLLVEECHKHGARVLSMTLPETIFPTETPFDRPRQEFNRLLREELVHKEDDKNNPNNIFLLDVDRLIPQHSISDSERKRLWDDGVHLTPQGYDHLGQLIYEAIKPHLP